MNKTIKILGLLLVIALCCVGVFAACDNHEHVYDQDGVCTVCGKTKCELVGHSWYNGKCVYDDTEKEGWVDYVSQLTFKENANRASFQNVTVKNYVDGDTTHFYAPVDSTGVLKARYLAVNTPESTGQVEPYGKVASNFTKEKLKDATGIILESDTSSWNHDSTGTRYTVWVWYQPSQGAPYRNLNLELLQEGLAIASNSEGNSYGEICGKAIKQAQEFGYRVHNTEVPDSTFYYGEAQPITMRELRTNIETYKGTKVAVEGVVSYNYNNGVYIEEYDENADISFGIYAYYGFTKNTRLIKNLGVGNRVRVVGTVSEFNGTYQISGLDYRALEPNDPDNTIRLDDKTYDIPWRKVTVDEFKAERTVTLEGGDAADKEVKMSYAALAQGTTICMENLVVQKISVTKALASGSRGAMSITCKQNGTGQTIVIRTMVLKDPDGKFGVPPEFIAPKPTDPEDPEQMPEGVVLKEYFLGKTISIQGIVSYYDPTEDGTSSDPFQINVFTLAQIQFSTQWVVAA